MINLYLYVSSHSRLSTKKKFLLLCKANLFPVFFIHSLSIQIFVLYINLNFLPYFPNCSTPTIFCKYYQISPLVHCTLSFSVLGQISKEQSTIIVPYSQLIHSLTHCLQAFALPVQISQDGLIAKSDTCRVEDGLEASTLEIL